MKGLKGAELKLAETQSKWQWNGKTERRIEWQGTALNWERNLNNFAD